jgi:hypothetical protein
MKLVKIARTKKMLKVEINGQEEWTNTSDAVYNFAKKAFKEGDEIELQYEEKDGMKFVNRITKPGQSNNTSSENRSNYTNKYKKSSSEKKNYYEKSPTEKEQIKRLSILSSACHAAKTVTGQVDANALEEYILNLYGKFYEKISE